MRPQSSPVSHLQSSSSCFYQLIVTDRGTDNQTNGETDERTDGRTDGRTDERTDAGRRCEEGFSKRRKIKITGNDIWVGGTNCRIAKLSRTPRKPRPDENETRNFACFSFLKKEFNEKSRKILRRLYFSRDKKNTVKRTDRRSEKKRARLAQRKKRKSFGIRTEQRAPSHHQIPSKGKIRFNLRLFCNHLDLNLFSFFLLARPHPPSVSL